MGGECKGSNHVYFVNVKSIVYLLGYQVCNLFTFKYVTDKYQILQRSRHLPHRYVFHLPWGYEGPMKLVIPDLGSGGLFVRTFDSFRSFEGF